MFYVFNSHHGFDRATASKHETLESAGWEILGYDQAACGVQAFPTIAGEVYYTPWQQPHRGARRYLNRLERGTEREALEAVTTADGFDLHCFTEEQAARCEAEAGLIVEAHEAE